MTSTSSVQVKYASFQDSPQLFFSLHINHPNDSGSGSNNGNVRGRRIDVPEVRQECAFSIPLPELPCSPVATCVSPDSSTVFMIFTSP